MRRFVSAVPLALACIVLPPACAGPAPVQAVRKVDVNRYVGTWYEIADIPRFFLPRCVADTVSEYTANSDGGINEAYGTATPLKGSGNTRRG